MRALVIYESMFGNTRSVAQAIGDGLSEHGVTVEVCEVGVAPAVPDEAVGLLVVGGPTHAFGLSRAATRASAAEQAGGTVVSQHIGLREWLEAMPGERPGMAAAFDTHVDKRIPGSAARAADRRLRRLGYRIAVRSTSFHVADVEGPLLPGELGRAREWGAALAARVPRSRRSTAV